MKRAFACIFRCLLLGAAVAAAPACGGPPPAAPPEPAKATWSDAIEGNEALVAVVRPKALARDPVFGPLIRAGFAAALAREGSTPSLEVLAATDELVVVLPGAGKDGTMLVLSGIDADRAPERVSDEHGQALFRPGADARTASEWVSAQGRDASLFVLPSRTWVIASGSMRKVARVAFANPAGRPVPSYGDDRALALVRLDGPAFLTGGPRMNGAFAPVARNLGSLTLALLPDKKGLEVVLHYANDDQAGFSALSLEDIKKRLAGDASRRFLWLATATIARDGNRDVRVHVDLPADFVDQVRRVSPQELITL